MFSSSEKYFFSLRFIVVTRCHAVHNMRYMWCGSIPIPPLRGRYCLSGSHCLLAQWGRPAPFFTVLGSSHSVETPVSRLLVCTEPVCQSSGPCLVAKGSMQAVRKRCLRGRGSHCQLEQEKKNELHLGLAHFHQKLLANEVNFWCVSRLKTDPPKIANNSHLVT